MLRTRLLTLLLMRSLWRLCPKLNRLAGREVGSSSKSKLHERFLLSKSQPPHRGLLFFPDLHTSGRATDLSLWAIKEMAKSIGWSMAALVASERRLWLNLSGQDKNRRTKISSWMLRFPLLASSGDVVTSVVERFQEAKKQAVVFQQHLFHRTQISGTAGW